MLRRCRDLGDDGLLRIPRNMIRREEGVQKQRDVEHEVPVGVGHIFVCRGLLHRIILGKTQLEAFEERQGDEEDGNTCPDERLGSRRSLVRPIVEVRREADRDRHERRVHRRDGWELGGEVLDEVLGDAEDEMERVSDAAIRERTREHVMVGQVKRKERQRVESAQMADRLHVVKVGDVKSACRSARVPGIPTAIYTNRDHHTVSGHVAVAVKQSSPRPRIQRAVLFQDTAGLRIGLSL